MRRDRVQRAIIAAGFGPLHETPPGGAPTGDPAPGAPTPDPAPAGGGAPAGDPDRSGWIPRNRFDEVNAELQRRRQADEAREREEAEKKGEFQKLADTEKAKREAAEQRATNIARRAAFIAAAAGKVADPEAAYKLAVADGLLNDLDVDDDGNAKNPKAPGDAVDAIVKKYEFLKSDEKKRSFSGPADGNGGTLPVDPSKMDSRTMLSAGYAASQKGR